MTSRLPQGCETCPAHDASSLGQRGIDRPSTDFVVALAGNPNTGKSTVFNALTGLHQHTGNWPGKTVSRAEGSFEYAGSRYSLVDLPGTYSLLSMSVDEEIARNFLLFGRPDVTVVVVDANRLERNLNLVLQVLEITDRVVVCLNLVDEARRHGLRVDHRRLARSLGVPVVPTVARYGEGLRELTSAIHSVATGEVLPKPHRIQHLSPELKDKVIKLTTELMELDPEMPNPRWVALRLLEGDERIQQALLDGELGVLGSREEKDDAGPSVIAAGAE